LTKKLCYAILFFQQYLVLYIKKRGVIILEGSEIVAKLLNDSDFKSLLAMCNTIVNKTYQVNSKALETTFSKNDFTKDCAAFKSALKAKNIEIELSCYDIYTEIIHPATMAEIRRGM